VLDVSNKIKEERYSRVRRLSDTYYSQDGDMQAAKRDCNAPPTLLSQYMVMWPVYRPNFSNIKAVDTTILDGLWIRVGVALY